MLDQSFSSKNFNLIFLKENRKGNFKKKYFSQEYLDKHDEFKTVVGEKIRMKRSKGSLTKEELDEFSERLDEINKAKERIRLEMFQALSDTILNKRFKFNIIYNPSNEVFTTDNLPSFFAFKQLQNNISKTFKVKQADRNRIIKQLYNLLADRYPKVIVRTDVKRFYESIPQDQLLKIIDDNTLLSPFSKKLIKKVFYEFEAQKDTTKIEIKKGVPRGIGVSAYLSELFMRSVDDKIKNLPEVIYYARYVDDIVVIFVTKSAPIQGANLSDVKKVIEDHGLKIKDGSDSGENKTLEMIYFDDEVKVGDEKKFDFLGYEFDLSHRKTLKLEISRKKKDRYVERLKASMQEYNATAIFNEKRARKELVDRIKFLTGNFHLTNNKRHVKAGIYYSNSMLSLNPNQKSTYNLQMKFIHILNQLELPDNHPLNIQNLRNYLKSRFSFEKGFNDKEKNFYTFKLSEKEREFYSKKYSVGITKFDIIKSIWNE